MENGMPADFELPEVEGHWEGTNAAMLEADPDQGHMMSPAPPQGALGPFLPFQLA